MFKKILIIVFLVLFFNSAFGQEEKWQERRGQHFIIYYDKDVPNDFINNVQEVAEGYYDEIMSNLGFTRTAGWTWENRAKIYIYSSMESYAESARVMKWSHGSASAQERTIRTYPAAHGFFDSTLPHELAHIMFGEYIGFFTPVPLWLHEGVAMFQERAKRWGANDIVRKAIDDGSFIPLTDLSEMSLGPNTPSAIIDLFYAESASIVYYMIVELGQYRFVNFCRALKEGKNFEQALYSAYFRFKNVEDLNNAWITYLK